MVRALDIFDAAVDEALFTELSDAGEGDIAAMLTTLTTMVEELSLAYVAEQLAPAMPALIDDEGAKIINPIWSDNRTFAPLYVLLAKLYYETIAPSDFPSFPTPRITADPMTVFGVRFEGFDDSDPTSLEGESMGVFAGCCSLAVINCFHQPITLALGYLLSCKWKEQSREP